MEEQEFRRLLGLFPVVRSRDYHAELNLSRQSTSQSLPNKEVIEFQDVKDRKQVRNQGVDLHDAFWHKLKLAAERTVGAEAAERFCQAFQHVHKKLVYEGMSSDVAQRFLSRSNEEQYHGKGKEASSPDAVALHCVVLYLHLLV